MRKLSIPEQHQLRIARQTLCMSPATVPVMGGPSIEEARVIIKCLIKRTENELPDVPVTRKVLKGLKRY